MAKAKKKAAPKRAAKSTALVVRKRADVVRIEDPKGFLPVQTPVGQLGELATVGALGLAEVKLTEREEAILSEPVNPADILVRDGGISYLPHIVYTRWFNRAFGRTGWAIVPTAAPKKADRLVIVPYLLYVHGVPVAAATGEHEYQETNARQTYGDVIESTVASALRRCAKRLGVGLEMWDKAWLSANTGGGGRKPAAVAQRREPVPPVVPAASSGVITAKQWERLKEISTRAGRDDAEVKAWLKARYGALTEIGQQHYAAICTALEARGDLVFPGDH